MKSADVAQRSIGGVWFHNATAIVMEKLNYCTYLCSVTINGKLYTEQYRGFSKQVTRRKFEDSIAYRKDDFTQTN